MEPGNGPSLDEVGEAEAVLLRLVHERHTLEKAALALQVYKAAIAQSVNVQQQLVEQQIELGTLELQVDAVEQRRVDAVEETRVQLAQVKETMMTEAYNSVAVLQEQIVQLQNNVDLLHTEATMLKVQNEQEQAAHVNFVNAVEAQVAELRKEYTDLQDAFVRSSKILGSIAVT